MLKNTLKSYFLRNLQTSTIIEKSFFRFQRDLFFKVIVGCFETLLLLAK